MPGRPGSGSGAGPSGVVPRLPGVSSTSDLRPEPGTRASATALLAAHRRAQAQTKRVSPIDARTQQALADLAKLRATLAPMRKVSAADLAKLGVGPATSPGAKNLLRALGEMSASEPKVDATPTKRSPLTTPQDIERRRREREAFDAMVVLPGGIDALCALLREQAERDRLAEQRAADVERQRDAERRWSKRQTLILSVLAIIGGPTLAALASAAGAWLVETVGRIT